MSKFRQHGSIPTADAQLLNRLQALEMPDPNDEIGKLAYVLRGQAIALDTAAKQAASDVPGAVAAAEGVLGVLAVAISLMRELAGLPASDVISVEVDLRTQK